MRKPARWNSYSLSSTALASGNHGGRSVRILLTLALLATGLFASRALADEITYTHDAMGQLTAAIDDAGTTANAVSYSYDPVGNILAITTSSSSTTLFQPTFSPASGAIGSTVTISVSPIYSSNNVVLFNGVKANITGSGTGTLTVTVPAGATTGPVQVNSQVSASNFTVQ